MSGHAKRVTHTAWYETTNIITSGDEEYLYVWKQFGNGWEMQALDVSAGKGLVSCICIHPHLPHVVCGFARGAVKLFEVTGNSVLLATA